ncbi:MAG: hypothetical protein IKP53_05680 [Candidatus Methanomethylophilaceae archaeon]|jgi:hypothetical protein|nr:hypothetical protein [Candidatus Methanomethylophilaceae archaeon]
MGLFDNIKKAVNDVASSASSSGNKSVDIVFPDIGTLEEFKALPQAALSTPFDTAAMTVLALCFYPQDKNLCFDMLNFLKGPESLSEYEKSFINDRFRDSDYVPRSYFKGATPQNDYLPSEPLTITVSDNPYSYQDDGYATMHIRSGGADSPRQVKVRKAKDGKWYLWEQFVLVGIRPPEGSNPWA